MGLKIGAKWKLVPGQLGEDERTLGVGFATKGEAEKAADGMRRYEWKTTVRLLETIECIYPWGDFDNLDHVFKSQRWVPIELGTTRIEK